MLLFSEADCAQYALETHLKNQESERAQNLNAMSGFTEASSSFLNNLDLGAQTYTSFSRNNEEVFQFKPQIPQSQV